MTDMKIMNSEEILKELPRDLIISKSNFIDDLKKNGGTEEEAIGRYINSIVHVFTFKENDLVELKKFGLISRFYAFVRRLEKICKTEIFIKYEGCKDGFIFYTARNERFLATRLISSKEQFEFLAEHAAVEPK